VARARRDGVRARDPSGVRRQRSVATNLEPTVYHRVVGLPAHDFSRIELKPLQTAVVAARVVGALHSQLVAAALRYKAVHLQRHGAVHDVLAHLAVLVVRPGVVGVNTAVVGVGMAVGASRSECICLDCKRIQTVLVRV
jgi:hypothetical protein